MTTPAGATGWDSGRARHSVPGGGYCREVVPDASPACIRAETRCWNGRAGSEPSNAPVAVQPARDVWDWRNIAEMEWNW